MLCRKRSGNWAFGVLPGPFKITSGSLEDAVAMQTDMAPMVLWKLQLDDESEAFEEQQLEAFPSICNLNLCGMLSASEWYTCHKNTTIRGHLLPFRIDMLASGCFAEYGRLREA